MGTTGITVEHEDIVEELRLARTRFLRADFSGVDNRHLFAPPTSQHDVMPPTSHHDVMPPTSHHGINDPAFSHLQNPKIGGYAVGVAAIDEHRLERAAERAREEIITLRRSRDDLLEANNRYLERARAAEALMGRLTDVMTDRELQTSIALGDAARGSIDLGSAIADLGKFVDMIEARAMAVDGPITPFCEELHAASVAEKERFQAILSKLYQFRNCWQMVTPAPLVTPEWVQEKAALEDGLDPTTGRAFDPNWSQAWKTICEVFHALGYPRIDEWEHTAVISSIAGRADSLDFVEMLIEVEKHSGFLIDENELPHFKICTIGDVVRLLSAKMAKAGAA